MSERSLSRSSRARHRKAIFRRHWQLYLMMLLPLAFVVFFKYVPMYGLTIAFKNYSFSKGIAGSKWVGIKHFEKLFGSYMFPQMLGNTLLLSLYTLAVGFPVPILLAVLINECRSVRFRKFVQMVSYAPHFITTVVIVAMLSQLFNYYHGIVNIFARSIGLEAVNYMGESGYFRTLYVISNVWQNMGYNSIIYVAALSGVDPQLEEAATIDGASRLKKVLHVDLPTILPTIIIMLILRMGSILSVGYEKVYLMQNDTNINVSEVISTYVYKMGLLNTQYSFAAATDIFNSVVNLILIVLVNTIARKVGETSLW